MKTLLSGLLISSLAACAATADTVLSFSADFKFTLPQSMITGATVFASDELSAESEQLSPDFDMQIYPEYLLKRATVTGLPSKVARTFGVRSNC